VRSRGVAVARRGRSSHVRAHACAAGRVARAQASSRPCVSHEPKRATRPTLPRSGCIVSTAPGRAGPERGQTDGRRPLSRGSRRMGCVDQRPRRREGPRPRPRLARYVPSGSAAAGCNMRGATGRLIEPVSVMGTHACGGGAALQIRKGPAPSASSSSAGGVPLGRATAPCIVPVSSSYIDVVKKTDPVRSPHDGGRNENGAGKDPVRSVMDCLRKAVGLGGRAAMRKMGQRETTREVAVAARPSRKFAGAFIASTRTVWRICGP